MFIKIHDFLKSVLHKRVILERLGNYWNIFDCTNYVINSLEGGKYI